MFCTNAEAEELIILHCDYFLLGISCLYITLLLVVNHNSDIWFTFKDQNKRLENPVTQRIVLGKITQVSMERDSCCCLQWLLPRLQYNGRHRKCNFTNGVVLKYNFLMSFFPSFRITENVFLLFQLRRLFFICRYLKHNIECNRNNISRTGNGSSTNCVTA